VSPMHPVLFHSNLNGLFLKKIVPTVTMALEDANSGYLAEGNDWWWNTTSVHSYQYFSIDPLYPPDYFQSPSHPSPAVSADLYSYMQDCFQRLSGQRFRSVLELGTGGGEITREFRSDNLDFVAVEGTTAGFERLVAQGIPEERIVRSDLRRLRPLGRQFDLVMCTEVAEHIEPFFASKIAENCVLHAPVVWFSCADRNRPAHVHHPNEQELYVWDNLFAFMGHSVSVHLDNRHARAGRIYLRDGIVKQA
jgi:hypothetical protein